VQIRELIREGGPDTRRLFPPAYGADEAREAEYQRLMRSELADRHLEALRTLEETLDAPRLDQDQLTAWLRALNDVRLVLGTRLDVTEDMSRDFEFDPDDPNTPGLLLYVWLSELVAEAVEALS